LLTISNGRNFLFKLRTASPLISEVNEKRKCWFYLAAVYSLRAAWEITKKGIEEKLIVGDAESFKEETKKVVSYYDTVDRISHSGLSRPWNKIKARRWVRPWQNNNVYRE